MEEPPRREANVVPEREIHAAYREAHREIIGSTETKNSE